MLFLLCGSDGFRFNYCQLWFAFLSTANKPLLFYLSAKSGKNLELKATFIFPAMPKRHLATPYNGCIGTIL